MKLFKNIALGYVLGFFFFGYGLFWLIPSIEWPWTTGLVGAFVGAFGTLLIRPAILKEIALFMATISFTGLIGISLMIVFKWESNYPTGPICTILGIFIWTFHFLARRIRERRNWQTRYTDRNL